LRQVPLGAAWHPASGNIIHTHNLLKKVVCLYSNILKRVRASLELPTVVGELTVFLAGAIAHEPALAERWQPLIDQVRANHQVFLEASTND
jgi:hypothetical protein